MKYSSSSPIARKQMLLYAGYPVTARFTRFARAPTLGRFGAAGASVWSGPPVGQGSGSGAATGATQGAALGTAIVPGIGTVIGAAAGAIGGAIAGAFGRRDQEVGNFDAAVAAWQQNPNNVYAIANKYLPLAGLFDLDLKGPHIPIYIRYNRKGGKGGEEKFAHDLVMQVYQAAQAGKITPNDTPLTIMAGVVQPWIDSWGFGPMQDPHADLINRLIIGMIADYTAGAAPQIWRARGGDLPASFASLPAFSLPQAAPSAPAPVTQATPAPPTAAPQPPFPGFAQIPVTDARLSVPWQESENNYTTMWTPVSPGMYSTTYGTEATQFQLVINGSQVLGLRKGASGWGAYTGTIAPDGVSVSGTVTWYPNAGGQQSFPFQATIQVPVSQPAPVNIPLALPAPIAASLPDSAPSTPAPIAPAAVTPTAAGVAGSGLPAWVTWGAIAAGAYLLLATAHPARRGAHGH